MFQNYLKLSSKYEESTTLNTFTVKHYQFVPGDGATSQCNVCLTSQMKKKALLINTGVPHLMSPYETREPVPTDTPSPELP